jgi:hypothetical protein
MPFVALQTTWPVLGILSPLFLANPVCKLHCTEKKTVMESVDKLARLKIYHVFSAVNPFYIFIFGVHKTPSNGTSDPFLSSRLEHCRSYPGTSGFFSVLGWSSYIWNHSWLEPLIAAV